MSYFTTTEHWHNSALGYYWLTRLKAAGLVDHHGIAKRDQFGRNWVFELKPTGYRFTNWDGFACGERVRVEAWKSLSAYVEIEGRIQQICGRRRAFSLMFWNCEHQASEIWNGKEESKQVQWGIVAMIVIGAFVGISNFKK